MTKKPLLTFYSPHHALHNPRGEFLHGRIVPYYEMPQRIENIHESLKKSELFQTSEPSLELALFKTPYFIHDSDMINQLSWMSLESQARIRADYAVYGLADQLGDDEYYYESIFHQPAPGKGGFHNMPKPYFSDSTCPIGKGTWEAVMYSAYLAQMAALVVATGNQKRAYALCRPPGHHAGYDFMGGYCYVNNAAIAASNFQVASSTHAKVAILDVDYHHGNGTQDIFYQDPTVFFASIHADPAVDYPHTTGYADEIGAGAGIGFNLNIPLPHGTGDEAYFEALDRAIRAIQDFGAQALVVSLGFDTYINDPMGAFKLNKASYTRMGRMIDQMNLPTVYIQEGGYAVDELGALAIAFFEGVLADG